MPGAGRCGLGSWKRAANKFEREARDWDSAKNSPDFHLSFFIDLMIPPHAPSCCDMTNGIGWDILWADENYCCPVTLYQTVRKRLRFRVTSTAEFLASDSIEKSVDYYLIKVFLGKME